MSNVLEWKKVYESDLSNIVTELKENLVTPAAVILSGEVGAGKTTFTRHFCDIGEISSPTYAMINEVGKLAHADLYRIEDENDLIHLEIPLYLENKEYFLIEWGKQWIKQLQRDIPDEFILYELVISVNEPASTDSGTPSRNYRLSEIFE